MISVDTLSSVSFRCCKLLINHLASCICSLRYDWSGLVSFLLINAEYSGLTRILGLMLGLISTTQPDSLRRTMTSGSTYCDALSAYSLPGFGLSDLINSIDSLSALSCTLSFRVSVAKSLVPSSGKWSVISSIASSRAPIVFGSACNWMSKHSCRLRWATPRGSRC